MANYKTIMLDGAEQEVKISGQNCDIRNDGTDIIYASNKTPVSAGGDGVLSIPVGQAAKLLDSMGTVYLLGTGTAILCGNDYGYLVFKTAATSSGEGGGVDQAARDAVNALTETVVANKAETDEHAENADIHLTAEKAIEAAATAISNPNLLINPDFKINQRGLTEYTSSWYNVDQWHSQSAKYIKTVQEDGIKIECIEPASGWIENQVVEWDYTEDQQVTLTFKTSSMVGEAWTVGITAYDDNAEGVPVSDTEIPIVSDGSITRTVSIPSRATRVSVGLYVNPSKLASVGDTITLHPVKLELGSVATPFTPPDPATELLKCQRYYYKNDGLMVFTARDSMVPYQHSWSLPVAMRVNPTITVYDREGTAGYASQRNDNTVKVRISTSISNKKDFILWSADSELVANKEYVMSYEASAEL